MVVVSVSTASKTICIPADRLSDGDEEILRLLSNGGKRLQNDVAIFGADPERTRSVVRLQMEPSKVLLLEDVRH